MQFGTDGVRGAANTELTAEFALNLGRAAAQVLSRAGASHAVDHGAETGADSVVDVVVASMMAKSSPPVRATTPP